MKAALPHARQDLVANFKVYHDLMAVKVREILLVSSPYDAFIMEEDGSLASRIISEYRGLNLSEPPRIRRVSTGGEALSQLGRHHYDLVFTMPQVGDMDGFALGDEIKKRHPALPVILITHSREAVRPFLELGPPAAIDNLYLWSQDPDLLLAIIKSVEDRLNVNNDTARAKVRVLLLVEDSPVYRSRFLPLVYREVVRQTQAVLDESLNEEHRLLKMRARPKILLAENFEEAMDLYHRYQPYVFGVISDTRFPRNGEISDRAGAEFLAHIRREVDDLPLLLLSSRADNRRHAREIPAFFLDKNDPALYDGIHNFFLDHLGFGDFVFRMPDGREVDRAASLAEFQRKLAEIPEESLVFHAERNHFSNWIMARSEVGVASLLHKLRVSDFADSLEMRRFLIDCLHELRLLRQQGVVIRFSAREFDAAVMDFVRLGEGSLGGKARGLAFMATLLTPDAGVHAIPGIRVHFPKTLAVAASGFDDFVGKNGLESCRALEDDQEIGRRFLAADLPEWLEKDLAVFLRQTGVPLTVRSSSLLEDARFRPYAGLYRTYMLPNNHPDFAVRLRQLAQAVKLVYASTWYAGPRAYSARWQQSEPDSMAVIVQRLAGQRHGRFFYPVASGVAQSYNYYPVSYMKAEEGVAYVALGFGKAVVEGEKSLRFSPRYPKILPQFSSVDDILANSQRQFYALRMEDYPLDLGADSDSNLVRRQVDEAGGEPPVQTLASTYSPAEHRIRDGSHPGQRLITFARLLKYHHPLPEALTRLLDLGCRGVGCDVEIEFALNTSPDATENDLYFLQIRPMAVTGERFLVAISEEERERAFCVSDQALGHGRFDQMTDIIYVRPENFDPAASRGIAAEIGRLNRELVKEGRPYLLAGPGRWGSADPWLGIPVAWEDISGVGAMVELRNRQLRVDPSQGAHFFHNITSLGIPYLTVTEGEDVWDRQWLASRPAAAETGFLRHLRLPRPFLLKVDSAAGVGVILEQM